MKKKTDDLNLQLHYYILPLFLLFGVITIGCSAPKLNKGQKAIDHGKIKEANQQLEKFAKEAPSRDTVLAYLELGYAKRCAGKLEESNKYFRKAEEEMEKWSNKPEFKVSDEGLSLFTNLRMLPYRGRNRDRIMVNTYTALNYLEQGEVKKARVELRKAYEWQAEAVHRNKERIEEAKSVKSDEEKVNTKVQKTRQNEKFQKKMDEVYADLEDKYEPYANYVNPFSEWLQGIYYLNVPADSSDLERSEKSLERVNGMVDNNKYLRKDLKLSKKRSNGKSMPDLTYVIFATGNAPYLEEQRIDLPLFVVTDQVDYFGVAIPTLTKDEAHVEHLTARAKDKGYRTQLLADMDRIVAREFKNRLPAIVTKSILSGIAKASAVYAARKASEQAGGEELELAVRLAGAAYQAASTQADTRSWESLPKEFQYARFKTPEEGQVRLELSDGNTRTVDVQPNQSNFIYVRSYRPGVKLDVNTFSLSVNP